MAVNAASPQMARLGLGTAKLGHGADRGPNGARAGRADAAAAFALAARAGVRLVDAGAGPDLAEDVFAQVMRAKTAPFRAMWRTGEAAGDGEVLEASVRQRLGHYGSSALHAVVVSRADSLLGPHGDALWARLRRMKDEGLCERLGVAVELDDQPAALARRFRPDFVQAPLSLVDQRFIQSGAVQALADLGVAVQAHAVFLRGLWLQPVNDLGAGDAELGQHLSRARRLVAEAGADPLQAALGFALHVLPVEAALVGVASSAELKVILAAASAPAPDLDWAALAYDPCEAKLRRSAA
jgi:D-threo-aldose 1-dehydrogenase